MATKASWMEERTAILLDCFCRELARGKGTDAGCSTPACRLSGLKAKYSRVHALRTNSGFGWYAAVGLATALEEVWSSYIAAHPKSAVYRNIPFTFYDQVHAIFSGAVGACEFAVSDAASTNDYEESTFDSPIYDTEVVIDQASDTSTVRDDSLPLRGPLPASKEARRMRRSNTVAYSVLILAQTQQAIHEGRISKAPSTVEQSLKLF
ncbi:hypothetical protein Ae201684_005554 [Aphanomyces euteiches]|uniref:Uncharacterized protein n=1 Tax=Aphanomyces euteiches TaxID=100861 RepID=A0A6G0XF24_9STRA|nr:hypothetical protein Ae201684_005554 [Aphanomyces euteiches]